jgi:lipopolysaccharide/colanic/teichoic acid biosynthesis glycosyltransferase
MNQGSAGRLKIRSSPEDAAENLTTLARDLVASGGYGTLHLVEVDHHSPNRLDLGNYEHCSARPRLGYLACKRVFDVVAGIAVILVLSPVIAAIVACLYATGGSPLFRHRRVGKDGVLFECLKFRTMVKNADQVLRDLLDSDHLIKEEWLKDHKLKDDPRVTRLGRFLRISSLDELPQLWNVLRGEMSLVGPRPVVPEELGRYKGKVAIFLAAKPGITGLWQISGRTDIDYRSRVALDLCYVRSRSFALDLLILIKTLPSVFARDGAY